MKKVGSVMHDSDKKSEPLNKQGKLGGRFGFGSGGKVARAPTATGLVKNPKLSEGDSSLVLTESPSL